MERIVRTVTPSGSVLPQKLRVAAYARVSSGKDAMLHSLSAQISYYSGYIQRHPNWEYVGVYSDEALTGTKDNRPEFQRLLADCRAGKIDMVITKSISRFARNTVSILKAVRELTSLNVDVYFEKENIHSIGDDGELMLSILASYTQAESLSVSENCKWRIRKQYAEGRLSSTSILGYTLVDGKLEIVPKEAEIVKRIFSDFLSGLGRVVIAERLNEDGIKTKRGGVWSKSAIFLILRNEKLAGDLLLQKTFIGNHIDKKRYKNTGQLPRFYVERSHEPIIDKVTFDLVQKELERRAEKYNPSGKPPKSYPFSGKIVCGGCGKHYRRRLTHSGSSYEKQVWICPTFNRLGKEACSAKQIPEDILLATAAEVMGLTEFHEECFSAQIREIIVLEFNKLVFVFTDGHTVEKVWKDRSRKESWSEEAKAKARERKLENLKRSNT